MQEGGYLIVLPDGFGEQRWARSEVLGKAIPVAPGPAWLARRAGKPLVPFMVIPGRRGWRVWIGEPVAPTQESVAAALAECLRRAPTSLYGILWHRWRLAPAWVGGDIAADEQE